MMNQHKYGIASKSIYFSFVGLNVLGLLNSCWLLYLHYADTPQNQLCAPTGSISCRILQNPDFSEWLGVPVPVVALIFYSLFMSIVAFPRQTVRDRQDDYLLLFSLGALFTTLYFAVVSFFVLRVICPYCFLSYFINGGLIGLTLVHLRRQQLGCLNRSQRLLSLVRTKVFWVVIVVAVGLFALCFYGLPRKSLLGDKAVVTEGDGFRTLGEINSRIRIVEFSDFQCPACSYGSQILKDVFRRNSNHISLVYKFFPLDPKCNVFIPPTYNAHSLSCDAAIAAYCSGEQGKFWLYHDLLFENQRQLTSDKLLVFARAINLDVDQFSACRNSPRPLAVIEADVTEGNKLQLEGTPTLFINGQRYLGQLAVKDIEDALGLY